MNRHALLHTQKSNYAYGITKDALRIRLRAAKDDLTKVEIIYADKFDMEHPQTKEMTKILSDGLFDYYETAISIEQNRYVYYFKLYTETEAVYFGENGVEEVLDPKTLHYNVFQFPFLHEVDTHQIPEWSKSAVFYQVFIERFYDGDPSNNPKEITPWGELPTGNSYYGGDLRGIIEKLDYLQELGINALYLTPLFSANTNHKYDTKDYMQVDPEFGTKEELRELVGKAHAKGMRVVLDAVFNHCGYYFEPFQDVLEKGKASKYFEWFHIDGDQVTTQPSNYLRFAFSDNMPKLNTSNQEVQDYLLGVATYWIEACDIDGWRLDVSDEIDHVFWRKFRDAVKAVKQDAIILGENWHDAYAWLQGDQYDGVMNYGVTKACLDFFAYNKIEADQFAYALSNVLMRNTEHANFCMLNLLDSHDTARILTLCEKNKDRVKIALTFLMSFMGMPCTYYGTEIAMEGENDPDCRRTFDWNQKNWDMTFHQYYKKIIALRKQYKPLTEGSVSFTYEQPLFVMERCYAHAKIVIVINNTSKDATYTVPDGTSKELMTDQVIGTKKVTKEVIKAYEAKMYYIKIK
ncbi:MAG: glycoside hydrolase family 13 protein [Cellulosilyticaceae bacterium]